MGIKLADDKLTPMEFLRGCVFDDGKLHKGLDNCDNVGENPDDVRDLFL